MSPAQMMILCSNVW